MDQGIPHNAYRFITHHHRSTSVQYGCEDGFRLIGKKKLRCRDDIGRWTGVPPLCKSTFSPVGFFFFLFFLLGQTMS